MMEEELRKFLRDRGWNLSIRKRGKQKREYIYAQKWRCGDAYLGPLSKIEDITEEHVLKQLEKAL